MIANLRRHNLKHDPRITSVEELSASKTCTFSLKKLAFTGNFKGVFTALQAFSKQKQPSEGVVKNGFSENFGKKQNKMTFPKKISTS